MIVKKKDLVFILYIHYFLLFCLFFINEAYCHYKVMRDWTVSKSLPKSDISSREDSRWYRQKRYQFKLNHLLDFLKAQAKSSGKHDTACYVTLREALSTCSEINF